MSRFADLTATAVLTLPGGCQCPGTPHTSDWIKMRVELGAQDVVRLAASDSIGALALLTVEWNLLDSDGTLAPLDIDHFRALFSENFSEVDAWIEANIRVGTLPNGSAAPSPMPSRGSGSRARTARKVA